MNREEEIRLVRKAVRGNPDAYGQLIRQYQEYLYRMAFLQMKNEQDALDLVGSVILKGYQTIKDLKNPEWFKTWICLHRRVPDPLCQNRVRRTVLRRVPHRRHRESMGRRGIHAHSSAHYKAGS